MTGSFDTEKRRAEIEGMTVEERLAEGQRISEEAMRLVSFGVRSGLIGRWAIKPEGEDDALARALAKQREHAK